MRLNKSCLASFLVLLCLTPLTQAEQDFRLRADQTSFTEVTSADLDAEIKFGQNIAARILGRIKLYDNKKINRYLNLLGKSLAMQANRPELAFHFAVLDADYPNAYSAPGGYVFITKGALALMQDEAELAAVLAHEIAHINQRHIVQSLKIRGKDQSNVGSLTRFLSGGKDSTAGAFLQAVDEAIGLLFDKGYQHEQEHQSDTYAIMLLAASGYDVQALKRYLQRSENQSDKTQTTHPSDARRYKKIDELLRSEGLTDFDGAIARSRFKQFVDL